jgi:hypothetical protein
MPPKVPAASEDFASARPGANVLPAAPTLKAAAVETEALPKAAILALASASISSLAFLDSSTIILSLAISSKVDCRLAASKSCNAFKSSFLSSVFNACRAFTLASSSLDSLPCKAAASCIASISNIRFSFSLAAWALVSPTILVRSAISNLRSLAALAACSALALFSFLLATLGLGPLKSCFKAKIPPIKPKAPKNFAEVSMRVKAAAAPKARTACSNRYKS